MAMSAHHRGAIGIQFGWVRHSNEPEPLDLSHASDSASPEKARVGRARPPGRDTRHTRCLTRPPPYSTICQSNPDAVGP